MEKARSFDVVPVADGIGILGSLACAVHCILTPLILVAGPMLPAYFSVDESFHAMLLLMILPASVLSFGLGCWRHKDRTVLVLGLVGLAGLTFPVVAPHGVIGEVSERWLTLGSAAVLISAHVRNFKRCRSDACDDALEAA